MVGVGANVEQIDPYGAFKGSDARNDGSALRELPTRLHPKDSPDMGDSAGVAAEMNVKLLLAGVCAAGYVAC